MDIKMRTNGASAGTCDVYYFNPQGKRYRSRAEVGVHSLLVLINS